MHSFLTEARRNFASDRAILQRHGIILPPSIQSYLPAEFREDHDFAMDAQPALIEGANAGIPAFLTTMIDPQVFKILLSPTKFAEIFGEQRRGSWTDQTAMFPVIERTGEVSSYGDYNNNGQVGLNANWPQRQSYLFQLIKQYGDLELERAGVARISWAAEIDENAALQMTLYLNLTYAFGVLGLQNYGLLNDPNLSAALTPGAKAATPGNPKWIVNGVVTATANEIYTDIQTMFIALVNQSGGLIDQSTKLTLALSPTSAQGLTATNSFNVNVNDLLKKNFPNIRIETAVQYAVQSTANPNGVVGGNLMQLIADEVQGQATGFCAFNEKMRAHKVVNGLSSFMQKVTGGTWGAVVRQPFGIAQMLGI